MRAALLWTINDYPAYPYMSGDYTLSNDDNKALCQWLMELKVSDGYSGNLNRCVNASERNISSMKTHDCHELCAKVLREDDLNLLDNQIGAKVAGPVQFGWMYPVERYLHKLKTYVRNKAHPKGSIAKGVLGDECLIFCHCHERTGIHIS
ncbi:hypothetical protein L3X38_037046 [Prunus dulcis]|uniref:DUF4218 domain-containing protein n=1 Tax=Prunus dulcis TaxID=3755 RepID=A0AAD4V2M2_PRUDU|nr:hypothetical protein L3X38_037046 [Prunus dulcis]